MYEVEIHSGRGATQTQGTLYVTEDENPEELVMLMKPVMGKGVWVMNVG